MFKALVIGCGNIGAGYDFDNEKIMTHTKALSLNKNFELSVYDTDYSLATKVAAKYNCSIEHEINSEVVSKFDCISLCTPTQTHYSYLQLLFQNAIKLVICEKPVSNSLDELDSITSDYKQSSTKVLVNYVRRFQPKFSDLKLLINELLQKEELLNVNIKYQKGFINNCSHALDLLEFLVNKPIDFTAIKKSNIAYDFLNSDPTLSMLAFWNKTSISIVGLTHINYGLLDIELYFQSTRITIKDAGQTVEIYQMENPSKVFSLLTPVKNLTECNKDFMVSIIQKAESFLNNQTVDDNFLSSIALNKKMLNYLYN